MVEHVVTTEGPIYFDLLVDRISRAHGFQRAKQTIREIIRTALGRGRYPHTHDDGQELIWLAGADTKVLPSFRPGGSRHHTQIPSSSSPISPGTSLASRSTTKSS